MPVLLNKSELNLNAAQYLCRDGHYATVCHPAYYSCLQLMKFKVKDKLKINYEQQEREIGSGKTNSHQYLIDKIAGKIQETKGLAIAKNFKDNMKELKKLREISDYKEILIDRSTCEKAIRMAIDLRLLISREL